MSTMHDFAHPHADSMKTTKKSVKLLRRLPCSLTFHILLAKHFFKDKKQYFAICSSKPHREKRVQTEYMNMTIRVLLDYMPYCTVIIVDHEINTLPAYCVSFCRL